MDHQVLNGKACRTIVEFTAEDRTRYAFDGIQYDPKTGRLVATDGKMLLEITLRDYDLMEVRCGTNGSEHEKSTEPVLLPAHILAQLGKATRHKYMPDEIVVCSKGLSAKARYGTMPTEATELTFDLIEGRFPEYGKVLDKSTKGKTQYAFSAHLLARIAKAAQLVSDDAVIEFTFLGKDRAAYFTIHGEGAADFKGNRGAIMPVTK